MYITPSMRRVFPAIRISTDIVTELLHKCHTPREVFIGHEDLYTKGKDSNLYEPLDWSFMTGSDIQRPKPYSCTRYASNFSMSSSSHDLACDVTTVSETSIASFLSSINHIPLMVIGLQQSKGKMRQ